MTLALDAAPPGSVALVARGALARVLLGEAALGGGGVVLALPGGGHALVGIAAGAATRAAAVMEETLGEAPRRIPLPDGAAALRAPPPPTAPDAGPRLRLLADAGGVARAQFLAAGAEGAEAAARALLAGAVPLRPGLRLFLECPALAAGPAMAGAASADDTRAPVAVLALRALADAAALAAREAALRQAGWGCGLLGDDAAALGWMTDGPRWALAPPGPAAPPVLPRHLVLLGPRPDWAPPWALHEVAA